MADPAKDADQDKDPKDAAADGDEAKKADGDGLSDAEDDLGQDDEDETSEDDEDDEDDADDQDTGSLGEFRVRVLPDGNIRLVLDDDDQTDDAEDSDDDDLERAESDEQDDPQDDDKLKKDPQMGKSQRETAPDAKQVVMTEESLSKALDALKAMTQAQQPGNRRQALLHKAQSHKGLSKAEARELFLEMGKKEQAPQSLADKVTQGFEHNEEMHKSMADAGQDQDVARFMLSLTDNLSKSLGEVCESVEASTQRAHAGQLVLSKAVAQMGTAIKLMAQRMQVIESQPVRQPKSLSARPMAKSFAGTPTADVSQGHLPSEEVIDTLTRMNMDSVRGGHKGLTKGHRNILSGIEAAMHGQRVDPGLLEEIHAYRSEQRAGA